MYEGSDKSLLNVFFHNKWVRLVLVLDVLAIVFLIGVNIYNNMKTAIIVFDVIPVDATVSVDGNDDYIVNGSYKMFPGNHKIEISHSDLDTKTFELELPGSSSTFLSTYLSADNGKDFSFYEMRDNYDSMSELLSVVSSQTFDNDKSAEKFIEEYGKTKDNFETRLPIIDTVRESIESGGRPVSTISIQEDDSCDKSLCVLVGTLGVSNVGEKVSNLLKEAGIDEKYVEVNYEE